MLQNLTESRHIDVCFPHAPHAANRHEKDAQHQPLRSGQSCEASRDATTYVCSRHPATGSRQYWHCDVHCEDVMNPNASKPIDGFKTTTFEHQLNMRTNDTSSVPKETVSISLAIPSKTIACNVGCHAQSTFRSRPENDIQMCANKPRGAERGLRSTRIVSLSIAMSSSPAAVAWDRRTCGNGWAPLKKGICSGPSALQQPHQLRACC